MAGLLEADLRGDEEYVLVLAVGSACGPSLERDVLEIGVLLDVPRERPGEPNGPGGELARRLGGIDQARLHARARASARPPRAAGRRRGAPAGRGRAGPPPAPRAGGRAPRAGRTPPNDAL